MMSTPRQSYSCFSRQYLSMFPLKNTCFGELSINDESQQRELMSLTLLHPVCKTYPPAVSYRKEVLKALISKLEGESVEVLDDLYTQYVALLGKNNTEYCFKTYSLPDESLITLKESTNLISNGTTGLNTWPAAQCLAEWLLENRNKLHGRCVLELGSGLGFTGITVIKQCDPYRFIFSDSHFNVLSLLRQNVHRHLDCGAQGTQPQMSQFHHEEGELFKFQSEGDDHCDDESAWLDTDVGNVTVYTHTQCPNVQVCQLNWQGVTVEELLQVSKHVDVVLAADLVYDLSIIPALVTTLTTLLHHHGSHAYVASTVRNLHTREQFIHQLDEAGISWEIQTGPSQEIFYYDRSVPVEILKLFCCTGTKHIEST